VKKRQDSENRRAHVVEVNAEHAGLGGIPELRVSSALSLLNIDASLELLSRSVSWKLCCKRNDDHTGEFDGYKRLYENAVHVVTTAPNMAS
jgi:hypothetical protein